jgi:GTP-binding protein of the ras superfamily involved in termination of M-phase
MSEEEKKATINAKIGLIGDAHTGKTTLMVKYVESRFVEDSIQTVGVSFMEKVVPLGAGKAINFAIWDLGGSAEFLHLLPLLCNDAIVLLFVFDLTRKATLASVREWYKNARKHNKVFLRSRFESYGFRQPFLSW